MQYYYALTEIKIYVIENACEHLILGHRPVAQTILNVRIIGAHVENIALGT